MFNKKKLQKEFLSYQSEVQASLKGLLGKLAEVRAIADAGERYAALTQFESDVTDVQNQLAENFKTKASGLDDQVTFLKTGLSMAGIAATMGGSFFLVTVASPVLAGAVVVGGLVSMITGMSVAGGMMDSCSLWRQADEKAKSMSQPFALLFADIKRSKEAVLDKELKGVAASSRFNELYRMPEVKLAFDAAAVRARACDEGRANRLDGKKFNP